jgi:Domain of unknown function (DUF4191)
MVRKRRAEAASNPADPASMGRIKQIRMVAGMLRERNPRALPLVALAGIGVAAVVIVIGWVVGLIYAFIPLAILLGLMAAMLLFGRFATSAQYDAIEGQPGAAAAVLQNLRGGFTTTPAIAANRNMDVVHRTVGKPGVILVGEGSPTRLPSLLAAEKRRISRIASQIPIYDFQVGNGEGQIPIRQLNRKIMKLPRNIRGQAVAELNFRLNALPQQLQMPKGPPPRAARMPKPPRPRIR